MSSKLEDCITYVIDTNVLAFDEYRPVAYSITRLGYL